MPRKKKDKTPNIIRVCKERDAMLDHIEESDDLKECFVIRYISRNMTLTPYFRTLRELENYCSKNFK